MGTDSITFLTPRFYILLTVALPTENVPLISNYSNKQRFKQTNKQCLQQRDKQTSTPLTNRQTRGTYNSRPEPRINKKVITDPTLAFFPRPPLVTQVDAKSNQGGVLRCISRTSSLTRSAVGPQSAEHHSVKSARLQQQEAGCGSARKSGGGLLSLGAWCLLHVIHHQ